MTQEVKDNWLKALESGKFKRNIGQLKCNVNDKHCCLGVLGVILGNKITSNGMNFINPDDYVKTTDDLYHPLISHLTREQMIDLYKLNDSGASIDEDETYNNVIPYIKNIEVI